MPPRATYPLLLALLVMSACARPIPPGDWQPPPAGDELLVPGVSQALARHRAATLRDIAYELRLNVSDSIRAPGRVVVRFTRSASAGDAILDFRGLELGTVTANGVIVEARWHDDHLIVPASHLRPGANALELEFVAAIAAAGASIIRYDDGRDETRYLYTLLVPADAQQLFPVFDQPDLKARLTLEIDAPAGWEVLANEPVVDRVAVAAEADDDAPPLQRWRFAQSEPMSTYVMAFAAGPWTVVEDVGRAPVGTGRRPMRLYMRGAVAEHADADTLFAENIEALVWLEQYFAMRYPFAKLDMLLAPAFPFGGMEHVGAIFYNESRFVFREPPTPTQRWTRASTIYHEVAHQWFGDLVTMEWFDDLWLKESFATYMAARVQDDLYPEAGAWTRFYLRTKPAAYAVDATTGTAPVWQELPNLDLAKSNYGPIVYNKAPAVLRQLEHLVGEPHFRDGVRLFLRRHAFGNATWRDLLAAIGEVANIELTAFGEHYILRAGMPVVTTELRVSDGLIRELALVQRPARPLPGDRGGAWPGRVRVRLGYAGRDDVLLDVRFTGERTVVDGAAGLPAPDFAFANDGDFGYGTFLPDDRSAAWFLDHAASLDDDLQRAMAWGALWDLVREAKLAPLRFVDGALGALPLERDETIAGTLLGRMLTALQRYARDDDAAAYAPRVEALLLERAVDDALDYGLRRASLDAFLAGARTPSGIAALREYLDEQRQFDGRPLGQPSRWSAVRRLLALGEHDARERYHVEIERDTTAEAARMAFVAGAAVPAEETKAEYYRRYFDDAALNEEWVTASLGAFNDPLHAELTLPYLRPALERTEWLRDNRRIFFLPNWIESFIGAHRSPEALAVVDEFLRERADLPIDIRRRVLQARDELERTVVVRGR
jgi:aminopeptidase N